MVGSLTSYEILVLQNKQFLRKLREKLWRFVKTCGRDN